VAKNQNNRSVGKQRANLSNSGAQLQMLFGRIFKAQSIYFYQLLGVTVFLVVFGLVMVLSASSIDSLKANNNSFATFGKQTGFALIGLLVMSLASIVSRGWLISKARFFYMGFMVLQLAVLFIGIDINGNRNWIKILGIPVQPSEFLKVAVVLHVSVYGVRSVR
jgi:cell division protein FtsW